MKQKIASLLLFFSFVWLHLCQSQTVISSSQPSQPWSEQKANEWAKDKQWLRGANFIPSTAINQLEMWQKETFDTETIDRELGWAENIGFNCMRVYLHHAAWEVDKQGFKERIGRYLEIANSHGIATIFVFMDDCWNPTYKIGTQPEPKPGVHNSGWVRDPGDLLFEDENLRPLLKKYVQDILTTFKDDKRIVLWDLYNEPGNSGYKNKSIPLLKDVFTWAREINPSQPLTSGIWAKTLKELSKVQLENSDIISYHNYSDEKNHRKEIEKLKKYNRPLVCTEYMARTKSSRFENIMPLLKENHVGAINWGLVSGKTNTIYAWGHKIPDGSEPKLWFHDIFRRDGTPYDSSEIAVIKGLTSNE